MTEEISLKPRKSGLLGRQEVLPGFHLVRQHSAARAGIAGGQRRALHRGDLRDVDFDEICIRNEGLPGIARHKIVQSDANILPA